MDLLRAEIRDSRKAAAARRKAAAERRSPIAVEFQSGVASSECPNFATIPRAALVAYARRHERGIRLKGDKAWNALTLNQKALTDKEFVINRLSHVIDHALLAIGRLAGTIPSASAEEEADGGDAGAILFGGGLLAAYMEKRKEGK